MRNNKKWLLILKPILLTIPLYLGFTIHLFAQTDLYSFPKIEEEGIKRTKQKRALEPFVEALSKRVNVSDSTLMNAMERGFGRSELIRLILISKKSGKSLPDLLQEREKGTSLKKISESAKLDNKALRKEALAMLKELETEEEKIKIERKKNKTATAGISGKISKEEKGENGESK